MKYGYFTNANQEVPEYDPGLNVNCPICEKLLAAPMKTISVLLDGDDRSFFYRTHKACYENLTEDEQTKLDGLVVDVRYMQKALQTFTPDNNACRRQGDIMKCDRCKGKGYRELVVGPHVNELGAVCGGVAKYDCRKCGGSGKRALIQRGDDSLKAGRNLPAKKSNRKGSASA